MPINVKRLAADKIRNFYLIPKHPFQTEWVRIQKQFFYFIFHLISFWKRPRLAYTTRVEFIDISNFLFRRSFSASLYIITNILCIIQCDKCGNLFAMLVHWLVRIFVLHFVFVCLFVCFASLKMNIIPNVGETEKARTLRLFAIRYYVHTYGPSI